MENNVLELINQAEERAAEIKAKAQEEGAETVAAAEKEAAEIARASEADLRKFRDGEIKSAENRAEAEYEKRIAESRADARGYADRLLESADIFVGEIVGRIKG